MSNFVSVTLDITSVKQGSAEERYPKVTLGQEIWNLEHGATTLIMWDTTGLCRFKHYHTLQKQVLQSLGYSFKMHTFTTETFMPQLAEITGQPMLVIMAKLGGIFPQMAALERQFYGFKESRRLKVGIIGEFYTIAENDINFDAVRKLQKMGVNVDVSVKLTDIVREMLSIDRGKEEEKAEARELLPEEIGGHGFHSIFNTIWYAKNGFDGVIHLMPLSCMPESTVESLVDHLAQKYDIPLYRFPIDESAFEVGFDTRLETFISMLKRRKGCRLKSL